MDTIGADPTSPSSSLYIELKKKKKTEKKTKRSFNTTSLVFLYISLDNNKKKEPYITARARPRESY